MLAPRAARFALLWGAAAWPSVFTCGVAVAQEPPLVIWYRTTAGALFPGLSSEQCASSLALSSCDATVAELAECVLAFSRFGYGASCGHYLEHEGCSGTVVNALDCSVAYDSSALDEACRIRVE